MINFSNLTKAAIITANNQFTYGDLKNNINKYSELFKPGDADKIAIYSENRPEWIFAFYAAWKNNATVVTIDFMSSVSDVSFILNDSKPEILFTSKDKLADVENILKNLEYSPRVIVFDTVELPEHIADSEWLDPIDKEKTAVIIYTSGTTGSPKGVMLSFTNLLANINEVCYEVPIITTDRQMLMLLPLHHILPLLGTLIAALNVNATIVMSPSMQSSDLLATLKNNSVGIFIGVPRLYEIIYNGLKPKIEASFAGRMLYKLLKTFPNEKLAKKIFKKVHDGFGGNLEVLVSGGAALSPEVGTFFKTLGFKVLEGYGMTEAAPMITFNRPHNFRIGSPGQKLATVAVEIRDGEIVAKGPNIMKGYYNRPEESAQVLKDGWLYTGDLGYFDKKGFLYITGRKKEIIILSNGKNINPFEIEDKLQHSSKYVSEVAVHLHKDKLHALIVPDFAALASDEIKNIEDYFKTTVIASYNNQASPYKRIIQFTLVKTEIPRTRLGKIQRFKLDELIEKPQEKRALIQDPNTEEYKTIRVFIESQSNTTISPDDHLEFDIALDSLGKLSLIDFIEKTFGIKIDEANLLKFPSVKKLVEFISDNKLRHKAENIDWSSILKEKIQLKLPKSWITQRLFNSLSKVFFKTYFRFKSHGTENLPEGACIIAPNHQSYFDGLFVSSGIKNKIMSKTYFYAKKKHVNNRFLQFLAQKNNVIVMDVNKDLKESIQKLAEVLKMERKIILFPEGTRTKDGNIGEFKKMFAILSKELNIPVVPVAISGAYQALPTGKFIPRIFSRIDVNFLQPIYPANHSYETLCDLVKANINQNIKV